MEGYTTILKRAKFEYEDRKSVFIGFAAPVSCEKEALDFLSEVKKAYPDAKHHVYAYVLRENFIMRFSDDREPQGTAGMPVLDSIRKNNLTDAIVVVIRYFGGTLLGTGGLVRAYTTAAIGALRAAEIVTYDIYRSYKLKLSYPDYQKIMPVLSDLGFKTEDTKYSENVEVFGQIIKDSSEELINKLIEITSGRIETEFIEEKFGY